MTDDRIDIQLEAYLDDRMSEAERADFEASLQDDHERRRAVETQQAIDAAIARTLAPPSEPALRGIANAAVREHARAAGARAPSRPRGLRLVVPGGRPLALAAALVLLVFGAWMIGEALRPGPSGGNTYTPPPPRGLVAVYDEIVDGGFSPDFVCRDEAEFVSWFVDQFGAPLRLLDEVPADVAVLGLGYRRALSPETIELLVMTDDTPVVVFVDRRERDRPDLVPPPEAGLNGFRREVGPLVLYEVSPLDGPRVLPHARTEQ
jgi:hypothetical protein